MAGVLGTPISGISGALYYKPAGTCANFKTTAVTVADDDIAVRPYLGFVAGDPIKFKIISSVTGADVTASATNAFPAPIADADTTYYVQSYTEADGKLKFSTTAGGAAATITSAGTLAPGNLFQVYYYGDDNSGGCDVVGQVNSWSLEVSRDEIEVTTINNPKGKNAPFREYISGFATASGSASVYVTEDDNFLAGRMIQDTLLAIQVGCTMKLYIDNLGTEALSRSITVPAVLLSANRSGTPVEAQMVDINCRAADQPAFDLSIT